MAKFSTFNLGKTITALGIFVNTISINAQQWENVGPATTVSNGGSSYNNLAIDATGNYYLSYYDTSVSKGTVQKFDGTSWSFLGGNPGITTGAALYNSLTLDVLGNVYYTNQGTGLEIRRYSNNAWTALASATTNTVNYHASATSPSNNALFTYSSDNSGTVRRLTNGSWEQVGNTGFSNGASFAEMVIGTNNKVYTCNVSSGVRVYEISTSATSNDTWALTGGAYVDTSSSSGEQYTSDIAIDSNNNLYVAYISNSTNGRKINVKKFDGTSWTQVGNANFSAKAVQHLAIAVSSSGSPYVVASQWDSSDGNHLRNTVYKYDSTLNTWSSFGGDFVSDGQAIYNDLIVDNTNNYLVLTYSQSGTKVKRMALAANQLSTQDITKNNIEIYPNPTNGIVNIKGDLKVKSVEIANTVGQLLSIKSENQQIDITSYPKGIYFVKINMENGKQIIKKVIKN